MEVENKRGLRSKIDTMEDWIGASFKFPDILDFQDYLVKCQQEPIQKRVCDHVECPYIYCHFHQRFDEKYDCTQSIVFTPRTVGEMWVCTSYLDV